MAATKLFRQHSSFLVNKKTDPCYMNIKYGQYQCKTVDGVPYWWCLEPMKWGFYFSWHLWFFQWKSFDVCHTFGARCFALSWALCGLLDLCSVFFSLWLDVCLGCISPDHSIPHRVSMCNSWTLPAFCHVSYPWDHECAWHLLLQVWKMTYGNMLSFSQIWGILWQNFPMINRITRKEA